MRKKIFFICFLMLAINLTNAEVLHCKCGSHDTSITSFMVDTTNQTQGCCTGPVINVEGAASVKTYVLREGVYYVATVTLIQPPQAQSDCCDDAA